VMINEAMAKKYWPTTDPIGDRLKLPLPGNPSSLVWNTIVGVVADARTESLADLSTPQFYFCAYQRRPRDLAIFLRGRLDTAVVPARVREHVQSIDRELPVFGAGTLDDALSRSLVQPRFSMELVGLFAVTSLLLAAIGIYGVISYIVSERRHEIGLRLALGAEGKNILRMVLRQGLRLAFAGAIIGLAGAFIVSRWMAHLLYNVQPSDPITFFGVVILFIGVALPACYLPALRATKVDPMIALRDS
jgi:FtsX-like permease family